jgi:arylsulfatase A-like enzyme/tetratricopeptide (TPR) repeat protein
MSRRRQLLAGLAVVALVAGWAVAAAIRGWPPFAPRRPGPFAGAPIILISIDTLRSDHLPAYGYGGVATPAIDALARDAVLFERAYSHVPLTLPSHASILSGRLPGDTGVRDNIGYHFDAARVGDLPVALARAGYATGGAVSAFVLRAETGIGEGFDFYDSQVDVQIGRGFGQSQRSGFATEGSLAGWLRRAAPGPKPVFAFLHLYEPHSPYTPPEPFASRYRTVPYDGEIATADSIVGTFVAELKRLGLYDRAILVLLSDHGEGLGDHGEREHGLLLYREALQVPLLLKLPGSLRHGTRVSAPAQLVDVYPTLLQLAGLPVPAALPGRSLVDVADAAGSGGAPRDIFSETAYPRLHFGWSELASLVRDDFHYIHGPDPELYDLTVDPREKDNALLRHRPVFVSMRAATAARRRELAAPAAADEETRRRLASLGYAASTVALTPAQRLPDPKAELAHMQDLTRAMDLFAAQRYAEAVPAFRAALQQNPRTIDAWENLALCLDKLGQLSESLAAYQKALELSGGAGYIAVAAGYVLLEMGRFDEAQAHAELARHSDPALAATLTGAIALARQRPEAAAAAAREAIAHGGAGGLDVGPLLTLAEARVKQGQLDQALELLDQAGREVARRAPGQSFPGLAFARGDILARMGRNAQAEQAFRTEIQTNPTEVRAFASLAMLYASEDRSRDALAILQNLVAANPSPAAYVMAIRTLRVLGDAGDAAALLGEGRRRFPGSPELAAL